MSLTELAKTELIFHSATHQQTYQHDTKLDSIQALADVADNDAQLYKSSGAEPSPVYVAVTRSTIFHPQGGGQPSDVGYFAIGDQKFHILTCRTSVSNPQIVLHFGSFDAEQSSLPIANTSVTQHVDAAKRLLFSRLHTAGHVLGTATRTLLEDKIPGFDELKANHFPDAASCEFAGSIDGKYKADIQTAVDKLVADDAEVRIGWWRKKDFKSKGLERLLPENKVWKEIAILVDDKGDETKLEDGVDRDEETRIRVVEIVGSEVYPCGGTHVPSTKECGKIGVKKISRSKGTSRVSYFVD